MRGVWINSVQQKRKFDRVCLTFFELHLGSTHGAPSESDVAPVSLQSWTYSITIGIWNFEVSYLPKCEIVHSPSIFLASSQTVPAP